MRFALERWLETSGRVLTLELKVHRPEWAQVGQFWLSASSPLSLPASQCLSLPVCPDLMYVCMYVCMHSFLPSFTPLPAFSPSGQSVCARKLQVICWLRGKCLPPPLKILLPPPPRGLYKEMGPHQNATLTLKLGKSIFSELLTRWGKNSFRTFPLIPPEVTWGAR